VTVAIKFCGLTRAQDVAAAAVAAAHYVGFVFVPKSPRAVELVQARALALDTPPSIARAGLVVDADDVALDAITGHVPLDLLQLHGAETPNRVAAIRARYGVPVMKAVGLAKQADLAKIDTYAEVADQILVDAKPPSGADMPGGNGLTFDWRLLAGRKNWRTPWMLAGGLTPGNVAGAVRLTDAGQVDVSSGVEAVPGVKDARKMADFAAALADL